MFRRLSARRVVTTAAQVGQHDLRDDRSVDSCKHVPDVSRHLLIDEERPSIHKRVLFTNIDRPSGGVLSGGVLSGGDICKHDPDRIF